MARRLLPPRRPLAGVRAPECPVVRDALALEERAELRGLRDAAVLVRAPADDDGQVHLAAHTMERLAVEVREEGERVVQVQVVVAGAVEELARAVRAREA